MDTATKFADFTALGAPGNWSAIDPRREKYLSLLDMAQGLHRENERLRNRVWALDRATHTNDPLEGEDG